MPSAPKTWPDRLRNWFQNQRAQFGASTGDRVFHERDVPSWIRVYEKDDGYRLIIRYPSLRSIELAWFLSIAATLLFLVWCASALNWRNDHVLGSAIISIVGSVIVFGGGQPLLSRLVRPTLTMRFEQGEVKWRNGWRFHSVSFAEAEYVTYTINKEHEHKIRTGKAQNKQDAFEVYIPSGRSGAVWRRVAEFSAIDADQGASQLVSTIRFVAEQAAFQHGRRQ